MDDLITDNSRAVPLKLKGVADDDLALARLLQQQEMVLFNMTSGSQQYEQEETLDDDSDEAYARRLQQQEGGWAAGTYEEFEEHMESVPDPEALQYEDLQALGDVIGTVSKGLPQAVIERLPTSVYLAANQQQVDQCCVCQCEYEDQERVTQLPCGHQYHQGCISEWLSGNKTCPTCNKEVPSTSEAVATAP